MTLAGRAARLCGVVGGVIRQAVEDAGASGLLLLEDRTPEGTLVMEWAAASLGRARVHCLPADTPDAWPAPAGPRSDAEWRRAAARILARERDWLLAHPANKTALLLCRQVPPESLLPLGDLYATQVRELAGDCTLPDDVAELASAAGCLAALDGALAAWLEDRHDLDDAVSKLPPPGRDAVRARLLRNRAGRRWPRRVPKLGTRTLWVDVFA